MEVCSPDIFFVLLDDVIEVETITIDQITKDWPRVDLIKIDAEGSDESIWRGMHKMLQRNQNITIFIEIDCSRYEPVLN